MSFAKYRAKSIFFGVTIIAATAVMLVLGFSAISKSGERYSFYTPKSQLEQLDPDNGSCVYGSASDLDCKYTTEKACMAMGGTWSQGVACNGQKIPTKDDKSDTSTSGNKAS